MPDDTADLDPDVAEQVERVLAQREAEAKRQRERNKVPKDFGDFVDRIADAVLDRAQARADERRKADEGADEEPSRGSGGDWAAGVRKFWRGGDEEAV